MNAAQVLLIHSLGGARSVATLLDPPVELCIALSWASGRKALPSERLEQLRELQHRKGKTRSIHRTPSTYRR